MMPIIRCYVSDETYRLLQEAGKDFNRKVEDMAAAAIENAAIEYKVSQPGYTQYTGYRP